MTVQFELEGQTFTALNGGPIFKFNEAISLQIYVEDQKELDYYWDKLTPGGDPKAQVCGWLKDKYGLSWQVVPTKMVEWFGEARREVGARHDRHDEDEQARHRRARTRLQRLTNSESRCRCWTPSSGQPWR